jgi:hypothetical protein
MADETHCRVAMVRVGGASEALAAWGREVPTSGAAPDSLRCYELIFSWGEGKIVTVTVANIGGDSPQSCATSLSALLAREDLSLSAGPSRLHGIVVVSTDNSPTAVTILGSELIDYERRRKAALGAAATWATLPHLVLVVGRELDVEDVATVPRFVLGLASTTPMDLLRPGAALSEIPAEVEECEEEDSEEEGDDQESSGDDPSGEEERMVMT